MRFNKKLHKLFSKSGLSQNDFSAFFGKTKSEMSLWLREKRELEASTAYRMSLDMGLDPEWWNDANDAPVPPDVVATILSGKPRPLPSSIKKNASASPKREAIERDDELRSLVMNLAQTVKAQGEEIAALRAEVAALNATLRMGLAGTPAEHHSVPAKRKVK